MNLCNIYCTIELFKIINNKIHYISCIRYISKNTKNISHGYNFIIPTYLNLNTYFVCYSDDDPRSSYYVFVR